jgi:hypothetical protein
LEEKDHCSQNIDLMKILGDSCFAQVIVLIEVKNVAGRGEERLLDLFGSQIWQDANVSLW